MKKNFHKNMLITGACLALLFGGIMNVRAIAPEEYEAVQQSRTIKGTVVDKNGEAVIGANVVVKGTSKGTITDVDGRFTLNGVPEKAVLSVTFVGYKSKEITLKSGQSQIKVELSDDAELLDEVVVVGYGTMKKRDLSGAVSQILSLIHI